VIEIAKEVFRNESKSILRLCDFLSKDFDDAVSMICSSKGRLVVSGMGKSGLIGRKISATFASLGTSSMFMHPAEAIHGDLGMIRKDDVILALSNSGETQEVIRLVPFIKKLGGKIISFTGNMNSFLAKNSDISLYTGVEKEACPMNLAPTSSTTATLAMGDALAVAVSVKLGIKEQDFAMFHPGGSLGKKLLYHVKDVMHTGDKIPLVINTSSLNDAILEISNKGFGFTIVSNSLQEVMGILTDGDIRRIIQNGKFDINESIENYMSKSPKIIDSDMYIADALSLMEKYSITSLIVADKDKKIQGIVHLHDLLGRGELKIEI
jgi:arabinose-5-phosphate isomerase